MIQARIEKNFPPGPESSTFALNLEFETAAGTTVLFGPSGSGKTLTLDSIAGFARPDRGRIVLDGDVLFDADSGVCLSPQRRRCGYVFQSYALFPHMTLRENLEFAAHRIAKPDRRRQVNEMVERFRLSDVAGRRPHELSGGQKQRCSIARSLIGAPRVLLLDEPARGLDAPLKAEFYDVLRQVVADFGTPILLVTHDLDECFELGERMLVLRNGRLVQSGSPGEVAEQPANVDVARLLGLYNLLPAEIHTCDPEHGITRVAFAGALLCAPYRQGHTVGAKITVCVRPAALRVKPRMGTPLSHQAPLKLLRAVEKPSGMRLEFERDVAVEMPLSEYDASVTAWTVEFPPASLRLL